MDSKLYADLDYSFLSSATKNELELFFANTNLTREERNKIINFLGKAFDEGSLEALTPIKKEKPFGV